MAPRSSVWDHTADKDLLLAIIEMGTLKSIMWPQIAEKMKAKKYTFSHEACRQHFQKIRKESRADGNANDDNSGGNSPVRRATKPTKKTPASTPQKSAGMTKIGSFAAGYGDGEDDDEEEMTQSSKRKRSMKPEEEDYGLGYGGQTANVFKLEHLTGPGQIIDLENDDLYDDNQYV